MTRALQQHMFYLLENCRTVQQLTCIHAQLLLNGFSHKNFLVSKLLSFYIASGDILHAHQAFNHIENPSTIIWNHMIRGYARSATPKNSILLYNHMKSTEAQPDGFTYSFLLNACTRPSSFREGEQLHGRITSSGFCSNVFVLTNLVNMYGHGATGGNAAIIKAQQVFDEMVLRNTVTWNSMLSGYMGSGDIDNACKVFDNMPERNVVSWTTMIAACAQTGRCRQAIALFREMHRASVELDQVALIVALSACAELGDLKLGRWIHAYIDKAACIKFQPQQRLVSLNNALIHMYAKCGIIKEAYEIFQGMPRRNVVSWTTMITGFAMHGHGKDALDIFHRMQRIEPLEVRPDEITFIGVLCACSHTGRVDEGRHYFNFMTRVYHIKPRIQHFGCMVDLLSRAGLLYEAHKLIKTMPIEPNDVIWGALLGGCRIHKDIELASRIARQLTELTPNQDVGHLVLLSNVYAAAGRWDNAMGVRQRMIEMGVRKPAGRSWIQVNGVIHDFMAGDQSHRHAATIYAMVSKITKEAEMAGHRANTSEVLLDVEEEEREQFLYHHSEKLAIAFGLISITNVGVPIRIVKNLRICTDCHSMAKFVSKIYDREISIRDRNRFHCFRGGTCSCNNYW